ncbi:hypothetical protein BpHYR1_017390 [Brachionus plicatilis]|uniref:Uncharacterized protein n=1 Tax=Brachionus plicatilis TaxID=10195 RepID=A0A3M7QF26_BRAPC|nr:hypothetical protein BpHYR1_017390 [Brachionus plicatilis]
MASCLDVTWRWHCYASDWSAYYYAAFCLSKICFFVYCSMVYKINKPAVVNWEYHAYIHRVFPWVLPCQDKTPKPYPVTFQSTIGFDEEKQ